MSNLDTRFLAALPVPCLRTADFDSQLAAHESELVCVFFWGHDCPNCEIAKRYLFQNVDAVREIGIRWFHVNAYEDQDLATRFGLFGIPTFLFFHKGKRLGKISPFPGIEPFLETLRELKKKHS